MSSTKPVLYSYFRSSASYRVRIALAWKDIEFDYKPVNLIAEGGGDQYSAQYKSINPMAQVPALVVGEHCLTQSLAILEYLEEAYPDAPRLLPSDPILRAKSRAISEAIVSGIQPLQNLSVLRKYGDGDLAKAKPWAVFWMEKGFAALEQMLQLSAGKYCVGDQVSFADCCLVPQVANLTRFGIDIKRYPVAQRVYENLIILEAFKTAHPNNQPDTPKK